MPIQSSFYRPAAAVPAELSRSVFITNILSSLFAGITALLLFIIIAFFRWADILYSVVAVALIFAALPVLNKRLFHIGRYLFCLIPVYVALGISLYWKYKAPMQSAITYFDVRYVMLASTILPAVVFTIEEKWKIVGCMGSILLCLALFDPIHNLVGLGYYQQGYSGRSYYYINAITVISFLELALGIIVLKIITGRAETEVNKTLIELNASNRQLVVKNEELIKLNEFMVRQSEELIQQKKEIQESRELIAEANLLISVQQEKLVVANKELEKQVQEKTIDLTTANEELIKHNNELRQFSYTVSHNLRAPVARLLGLTDLFGKAELNKEREAMAVLIQRSGQELDEILKDLHQIIDLRNDLYRVHEKFAFADEWQKITFALGDQIRPAYRISIDFAQGPVIYSIRAMIHSILYNLVSNAIKYRNPEKELTIDIRTETLADQCTVITVKDNGLGINLETQRDNIFKLYRRFHSHVEGKGLGLYLVKSQVDTLGGAIAVASEVNRGTTFTIKLLHPPNISKQVFFESDAAQIYFDAEINNTVILWKKIISVEEYRKAFDAVLHSLKTYHSPGCITDMRQQGLVPPEEQQWLFTTIIPEAVRYGLKRIAAVGLADPIRQNYLEGIQTKSQLLGVELRVFDGLEDAVSWMEKFVKHST
ncbi:MAG: hypothetical protein J0L66_00200 [Cytophagales bacterium]|nr:hypothetical protein [Cytophagales bacterium]